MAATPFERRRIVNIEHAKLDARAVPEQRWLDGWLLRLSPGKAKRARCVHTHCWPVNGRWPKSWHALRQSTTQPACRRAFASRR